MNSGNYIVNPAPGKYEESSSTIIGNHHEIVGSNNLIVGDYCKVTGNGNRIQGNMFTVIGSNNQLFVPGGKLIKCTIFGNDNQFVTNPFSPFECDDHGNISSGYKPTTPFQGTGNVYITKF